MKRWEKAMEAYKAVLTAPKEPGEDGWTPPPSSVMKDKKWSRELRVMWPEYRSVRLTNANNHTERKKWCRENAEFYWVANNGLMWYFSNSQTAVLFKLTFGGSIEL